MADIFSGPKSPGPQKTPDHSTSPTHSPAPDAFANVALPPALEPTRSAPLDKEGFLSRHGERQIGHTTITVSVG